MKSKIVTISNANLMGIRSIIQTKTGLFFPESKFLAVRTPILELFHASPSDTLAGYLLFISTPEGVEYFKKLISLFTTNETFFFRNKSHFEILQKTILPELIQFASTTKTLNIWSAGCSTGEEPYSIAILLKKMIHDIEGWKINLIATDLDYAAIKTAEIGEYDYWSFRGVDKEIIQDCFTQNNEIYSIKKAFKDLVTFYHHNLISDGLPDAIFSSTEIDLIICRNVTIYFEAETTKKLASKFHSKLRENGYLIVGPAEHSGECYFDFKSRVYPDAIIYQKNDVLEEDENKQFKAKRDSGNNDLIDKALNKNDARNLLSVLKERESLGLTQKSKNALSENRKIARNREETLMFNEALQFYNENDLGMSVDRFLRVLDINPKNVRACWMLCHVFAKKARYDESIAWGLRCKELDSLYKEPYFTLALAYISKKEYEKAAEHIKKAIYVDPKFTLGYFTLSNIYILMNFETQAKKCLRIGNELAGLADTNQLSFLQVQNITVQELLDLIHLNIRHI